ncbi:MAG: radical SAM protein [Oscillospiraceae bacterium]|nr:radical SAM protein [Oscillospiraceae bacterium]
MIIKQLIYLPWWFFRACILRKHMPLQTVLFITDYCNLKCKHCTSSGHAGTVMKSYEQVKKELEHEYKCGARFVDFEGGEPMLWSDGERGINDLVQLAKQVGFYSATVTTNGQLPLSGSKADSIWVSVDGSGEVHDFIRGEGSFELLNKHINESGHKDLSINMTVNKLNRGVVGDVIEYAQRNPAIKLISLNFHTPYPGVEDLQLPWDIRCEVIDEIIAFKKKGYRIMNSSSGLRVMKRRDFKKDCWLSSFVLADGVRLSECPGKELKVCDSCGFCMAGETFCVLRLKPDTIFSALRLRVGL